MVELMCFWHCYCVPTWLGIVDGCAMAALGLPKSAGNAKLDAMWDISHPAEGAKKAVKGVAQKFSMGVTQPTVPARLVKRILLGEFVDMGELSQDALWE